MCRLFWLEETIPSNRAQDRGLFLDGLEEVG